MICVWLAKIFLWLCAFEAVDIVHALQDKNKLNQRMDIPGNIYSGIESANALDCAENGVEAP
jgi:hypothetical protein